MRMRKRALGSRATGITLTTNVRVAEPPNGSRTITRGEYVPGVLYVKLGFWAVLSSTLSPSKSQAYVSVWLGPSGSVAAPPQLTVSGAVPACGVIVSPAADGLRFACTTTVSGALVT